MKSYLVPLTNDVVERRLAAGEDKHTLAREKWSILVSMARGFPQQLKREMLSYGCAYCLDVGTRTCKQACPYHAYYGYQCGDPDGHWNKARYAYAAYEHLSSLDNHKAMVSAFVSMRRAILDVQLAEQKKEKRMSKDNAQVEELYNAVYNAVCRLTTKWGKPLKTGNYRSIDRGIDCGTYYVAVSWGAGVPFIRLYASKRFEESDISLPDLEGIARAVIEVDEYYEQQANERITELVTQLDDILNEGE